ncbi:expressed unknown protein [Seminavis robusta]|uniref:PPIase cyclophilin-type domain-containing protein n=1 Tax=Seminavis robusta TaxID=568900 RepID=A0A9N8HGW0_9STRA|nr:expressed unknown protein [Seminavis robusta]|eukprot:Sro506_g156290.1 n/a (361) ;mRNA; f:19664-20848
MTVSRRTSLLVALVATFAPISWGWVASNSRIQRDAVVLRAKKNDNIGRRKLLETVVAGSAALVVPSVANAAVQRAVGGAEIDCREQGNCLEIGQLDGAVGWNWGGKDRCDASDPRCGPDGKLGDLPTGKPIPAVTSKITHVAEVVIDIGREESGVLHLGFYGEECPASVRQMLQFLTSGIATTSKLAFENGMGVKSSPVSLLQGGKIPDIVPGKVVDFGVPSQAAAYSRARGLRTAGDEFVPQPRPNVDDTKDDPFVRQHDVAGLITVPSKGIGYGGSGFESEDEAFESAFQIIADAVPALDKGKGRVIGQVIDEPSMAFLARLASIPTKKGIKGVVPGLNSGPPLPKVSIYDVTVKPVQ